MERLGSGAQGEVYLALLRGSQVAVKVFQGLDDRRNGMVMLHEIEMNLRAGRHPNVVQCKGLCSKSEHELLLIMEYCPRYDAFGATACDPAHSVAQPLHHRRSFAELLHVMKCKGRHIDPTKLLNFLRSVARGLQYLHARGILHRDVKPGNCFVAAHQVLKLGDLGHSCYVHPGGLELLPPSPDTPEALQWGPSTPEFAAPETWHPLRLPRPLDVQRVLKVDVYSFGVLVWQTCMLRNPYDDLGGARRTRLLVCCGFKLHTSTDLSGAAFVAAVWRAAAAQGAGPGGRAAKARGAPVRQARTAGGAVHAGGPGDEAEHERRGGGIERAERAVEKVEVEPDAASVSAGGVLWVPGHMASRMIRDVAGFFVKCL